jgi:PPM family protein phosphatase
MSLDTSSRIHGPVFRLGYRSDLTGADPGQRRAVLMTALITVAAAAASETGLVRQNNEDAAYSGRWLYAVADGMGGHAAGEVASAAVIKSLRVRDVEVPPADLLRTLGRAVADANGEVARRVAEDPARQGMGTTLTAMLRSGDQVAIAHIGDSRAFLLRGGRLRQITEDHTIGHLVADATDALTPVLARYLDGRPDRSPDLVLRELRPGDRYLLCSDGLSPEVADDTIRDILATAADGAEAVRQLVGLADEAGAPDNVTVIVIDVRPGAEADSAEPVTLGAAAAALTA